jgi:micrococcal nuclease
LIGHHPADGGRACRRSIVLLPVILLRAILLRALAGLAALAANGAAAQPAVSECGGATIATGEVSRVIDGKSFVLRDGSEVRLAAIEAPPLSAADPNEEHAAVGAAARAALEGLLAHRSVVLKSANTGPDRYGRLIGHVFVTDGTQEIWAQFEILTKGYALVATSGGNRACLAFLRGVERKARAAMLGLWGEPYYVMKEAQYPDDVMTELGRFALVGGKVISVRESGGVLYVNFGRRWTEDFTVTIPKRNQRAFVTAGVDPKSLAGRHIEVRGLGRTARGARHRSRAPRTDRDSRGELTA